MAMHRSSLWPVVWAPLAVIVGHAALAALFGHQRQLDPVFHFLGGGAGGYALLRAPQVWPALADRWPRQRAPFVLAVVAAVTLIWEVAECLSDLLLRTRVQHGVVDTVWDLVLGFGGAVAAVLVSGWTSRR